MTKYVNTVGLAEYFNVAPATIMSMVRSGGIPAGTYVRVGKVFRFNLEAIEEHLLTAADSAENAEVPEVGKPPIQLEFDFGAYNAEAADTEEDNV